MGIITKCYFMKELISEPIDYNIPFPTGNFHTMWIMHNTAFEEAGKKHYEIVRKMFSHFISTDDCLETTMNENN